MRQPERIIRMKTVIDRTGLSESTIYRKMKQGKFPQRVKISINGVGWYESEVNRWIRSPAAWGKTFDDLVF